MVRSFEDPEYCHSITRAPGVDERRAEKVLRGVVAQMSEEYYVAEVPACPVSGCGLPVLDPESELPSIAGVVHRSCVGLEAKESADA